MLSLSSLLQLWISSTVLVSSQAFVAPAHRHRPTTLALNINQPPTDCDVAGVSRRDVFQTTGRIVGAAASAVLIQPSSAQAATATFNASKQSTSTLVSNTLCDPSVSTWVKTDATNMRTIHILGTAHISSASAELAGTMVRELKPDVVFVELDAKRVARAIPGGVSRSDSASSGSVSSATAVSSASTSQTTAPTPPTSTGSITSTPNNTPDATTTSNPFDVQAKLVNVGSKYVGDAVKGMYGKLESEGFKAGDEFAMSVREGLAIGSTIVLGDRDVEVTLRRLTQALAKTDIRKLLSANSEVERSMEELLPDNMKNQLKQTSGGNTVSNNVGDASINVSSMGFEGDMAIDKQEFQTFVETMKAKENVKKIMKALEKTAPEIYQAMVAERDVYMARGLDELSVNVNGKVDNTVAVVGMAHVDGIERYLASQGWQALSYPCPALETR
jgi:hypothetical protein